jgi:acyl carrier protein
LTDDLGLYGDGLELDSLEAAELSAMLEDELGSDPFTSGSTNLETVGDILAFYAAPTAV